MAAQKNFEVDQNTTFSFTVEYLDDSNLPINLTGATAKMQVRDTKGGSKLSFTISSPSEGIVIEGPQGRVTCTMTPAQTSKLFHPKSSYDLMITDTNNTKTKLLEGFLTLSRSVTI